MNSTKRAVIYARVSTEEQATQGFSIQGQLHDLHAYAVLHSMDIVEEYIDEGVSGKSIDKRVQMLRLLNDARQKKFDCVLVYKIDRFARNLKNLLEIREELKINGVEVVFLKENIDTTTPIGNMQLQFLGSMAEFERNTIVERTKMGMTQRSRQGKWNGGTCLGYDSTNKTLIVNEEEAQIVRDIFSLSERGFGYKAIVDRINPKGYRTKKGNLFSTSSIKMILDNPIYIGKVRFNQVENWSEKRRKGTNHNFELSDGEHQPIISLEQWNRVQEMRKKRSVKPAQSKTPYILSGILKCPVCNYGMVPASSKGRNGISYRMYVCGQHHNKGKEACRANSVRAEQAEQDVIQQISDLVSHPAVLKRIVDKMNLERENAERPIAHEKKILQSKLKSVNKKTDKLVDMLLDDFIPNSIIAPKLQDCEREKLQIEGRLIELETALSDADKAPIDVDSVQHLLADFHKALSRSSSDQQKVLLRSVIKDITVSKGTPRTVQRINLHFDFTIDAFRYTYDLAKRLVPNIDETIGLFQKRRPVYEKLDVQDAKALCERLNVLPLFMIRFTESNLGVATFLIIEVSPTGAKQTQVQAKSTLELV